MPMPGMPPAPPMPQGPSAGGTSPAAPAQPERGGKEARGRVVAGLALELARVAIPLLGNSQDGVDLAKFVSTFGKRFVKPPEDLGKSELQFMQSQIFPTGAQGGPPGGGPPPMPGAPPLPAQAAA